jgi:hypothetical protein
MNYNINAKEDNCKGEICSSAASWGKGKEIVAQTVRESLADAKAGEKPNDRQRVIY